MRPLQPGSTVLVVNSGSSSLKYKVLTARAAAGEESGWLAAGLVERIAGSGSRLTHRRPESTPYVVDVLVADHTAAVAAMKSALDRHGPNPADIVAVGHRIVHGGDRFTEPTVVDDAVQTALEELTPLAPLHNPVNLGCLRAMRAELPDVTQVAAFDTAFHTTLPPHARTYAIPRELAERLGIRRWGFHGLSHSYVARRTAQALGVLPQEARLIICHIGNGVSVTAIAEGCSIDTSMGMTPLAGLVMGTRSGDIDPAVVSYLIRATGRSADEVEALLNHDSGLQGLCGESDVRSVRRRAESGDAAARLALGVYTYQLRKYIGAYLAVVPQPHAVVFTGGVGENDPQTRAAAVGPLRHLGLRLDPGANTAAAGPAEPVRIDDGLGIPLLVVPTDEELEIARQIWRLIGS